MAYARRTKVPIDQTALDIERLLVRYGATHFVRGMSPTVAEIGFALKSGKDSELRIRMTLPLPAKDRYGSETAFAQAGRARWRALLLIVKAKLEAVESGISTLEREFMADVMLPNGQTIGETVLPQVPELYRSGGVPKLLPGGS